MQDRKTFFSFLQERWPIFLKHITADKSLIVRESPTIYALKYSGPPVIPFDHEDIRVYIDTLFLDGLLQPVAYPQASKPTQQWITVGIRLDPEADRLIPTCVRWYNSQKRRLLRWRREQWQG